MPVVIGSRSNQIAVHRPVVVFAKRKAIGGVIVLADRKRDEMGGVDEADIVASGELDAEAAGGALVVVDGEDLAAEGGRSAVFERLFRDEGSSIGNGGCWDGREKIWEIPGDQSLAHELAVGGEGDEVLETIGEAGEDLA